MKLKSECMLCYTGAKPPAPVGITAVPPATTTIPQGSTVAPSGGPPIPAGGGGGGGTEGERPFCQSLLKENKYKRNSINSTFSQPPKRPIWISF